MKMYMITAIGMASIGGCAHPLYQSSTHLPYEPLKYQGQTQDQLTASNVGLLDGEGIEKWGSLSGLTLDQALRTAFVSHPEIHAAGFRLDAAAGQVLQSGLYPNPTLSFEAEAVGSDDGSGGESAYLIEQEIVLGNKLGRARDVAESDRQSASIAFEQMKFAVASQVSLAYFDALCGQARLNKMEELGLLAEQLLQAAIDRVDAGTATLSDQLRAEVVFEQSEMDIQRARYQSESSLHALALAIGLPEPVQIPLTSELDRLPVLPALETIQANAIAMSTKVAMARVAVSRAKLSHRLAKSNAIPNLVVSAGPRYSDIDHETTVDLGLSIKIPLFDRNQGEIQSAIAHRLGASAQLQSAEIEVLGNIAQQWSIYQSSLKTAARYKESLLPKTQQAFELTRQAYRSGKADLLRLLDAQQVSIESQIGYINAMQRVHSAAVILNELSHTHATWSDSYMSDDQQSEGQE